MMLDRQSTTVPNTSNSRACTCSLAAMDLLPRDGVRPCGSDPMLRPFISRAAFARECHRVKTRQGPALYAHLGAVAQVMVREHQRHHGLAHRHRADAHARVVAALGRDL